MRIVLHCISHSHECFRICKEKYLYFVICFCCKKIYERNVFNSLRGCVFQCNKNIHTQPNTYIFMHDTESYRHIVISSLKTLLWDFFPSNKLNAFHFSFQILSSKDKQKLFRNRKRKNCVNLHIFIAQTHTES